MAGKPRDRAERFWEKVDRSGGDAACWNWQAYHHRSGYGRFGWKSGKVYFSNRAAYELTHGPIPDGLYVLHSCDNRSCCNPAHLFLGTARDNTADMFSKGRARPGHVPGVLNGRAKLTIEQVTAIRQARGKRTQQSLADEYGVAQTTISGVMRGVNWQAAEC